MMGDPVLKHLDLGKYAELIRAGLGTEAPFALVDCSGKAVWASDDAPEARMEAAIAEANRQEIEWDSDARGMLRCDVDAGYVLLCERLDPSAQLAMWLAVLVRASGGDSTEMRVRDLRGVLRSLGACIGDEYRLNREVNGLAEDLSQRQEELNLVYSLARDARTEKGEQPSLRPLLERIAAHANVDLAAFVVSGAPVPEYAVGAGRRISNLDLVLVELRRTLFRFVMARGRPVVMNRGDDPRRRYLLTHMPYKVLATPVHEGSAVDGMLVLLRGEGEADFLNSDRMLGQLIADHVGISMRNHGMLEKLRKFGDQMASSLIEAIEAKDPYTAGHSERVQEIAVYLGRSLGMERSELEDLYWGSIMHDTGKIGVPDVILSKPGSLTDDEYTFVKIHPERSYEILRHIEYMTKNALDGARYHHERIDGKGYPAGLKGSEIPVHARIIAAADTYDAMTSSRSYRAALAHDRALDEMTRVAGTQLDCDVVQAFTNACARDVSWLDEIRFQPRDSDV
jgi:HD-GYP domain-containing protein (c-di-GMP phosphodiesterase class II)